MRLWIIRHGKAEQDSPTGRDEHRVLRDRGRRQAAWLGRTLRAADMPPTLILTSGLLRAVETARIIQQELGCPLLVEPVLETGHAPSEAMEAIAHHRREGSLAVVGHNPQLESLISLLVGGAGARPARLRTGEAFGVDILDGEPPSAACGRALGALRLEESPQSEARPTPPSRSG